ncbi:hypothetical protein CMO89_03600 [Candidatus Woesearchaeota archaeon]|nr:hypothetical protein [Candidatus Woesearchaeota archaeon]|tara:strand:+ start:3622 stop:4281 length:660 start_codon:yes stop_codon:yes gene_type:complete
MKFQCKHCGLCCSDVTAPVNLTLGDIQRITAFLQTGFDKLFWGHIAIIPFANPDKPLLYDLDLGLNMPCRFRINGKCSIYKARPLNCRLFPYWILSNPQKEGYKAYIDSSRRCIAGYKEDPLNKQKYRKYKDVIGKLILDESSITDEILAKNRLKNSIKLAEKPKQTNFRQMEIEKVKLCRKLIDKTEYKKLPLLINKELSKLDFISIDKLEETEKNIL